MYRNFLTALLVAAFAIHRFALASPTTNEDGVVVLKVSELRSAYLIRAGLVRYDMNRTSPREIQAQLQRHFDVVIALLQMATPHSIKTALSRLEAADNHDWSLTERESWRQRLLANRYVQLQRLAYYRDCGRFPLNEGQSSTPVPIFVDAHDTACAVGQLMRWSRWGHDVSEIERSNNLVYVPDALNTSVALWMLTSGLTIEEVALIQPAYGFHTPYLTSDYEPEELSLEKNGLKYENFHIEAHNFAPGSLFPFLVSLLGFHQTLNMVEPCGGCILAPISGGQLPNGSSVGFNAGEGMLYGEYSDYFDPIGTNWLVIGGYFQDYFIDRTLDGMAQSGELQRIIVSFDVSTTVANTYIDQIAEHSYPTYGGFGQLFFPTGAQQYEFTTVASHAGSPLGSVHIEDADPEQTDWFFPQTVSANLTSPANTLSVSSTIWLYDGATINSYVLGFRMVPEPISSLLLVTGLVLSLTALRLRRPAA